ncbi:methyltransferase family protein [Roseiarcus fermentans]|uniref:Methyltransferase family protein n=1 Tax=Roseiarcus fermentans TaxID=1473586 RepID=A0A366FJB3_9HYPH|nr:class I SAM-dependent methyltransferase [Roseiarcus fermentans]RBP13799.1 methyltransferase family protein [Roseiarcus fermentans]
MGEYNDLYRRAVYYDIVFRRDVDAEVEFLRALFEAYNRRPPRTLVDLACGPGYHARAFAREVGVHAIGLDIRPEMAAFAEAEAAQEALAGRLDWMVGDIRDFTLPEAADIALTSYDSLDCLVEQHEIVDHLRAVGRNLVPGGLYVVESTHPRDCTPFRYGAWSYSGSRGDVEVRIDWAINDPVIDPVTMVVRPETRMQVRDGGERFEFVDSARERFLYPPELAALAGVSGALQLVGWFGDFRLDQPLDNSEASRRMIAVMRRAG